MTEGQCKIILKEQLGLGVKKIPENSDSKSADFFCSSKEESYLVEFKNKESQFSKDLILAPKGRLVVPEVEVIRRNNTIQGILEKAAEQLSFSQKDYSADFRLIWVDSSGIDTELQTERVVFTFYGLQYFFDETADFICLGFHPPLAHRLTNVDAIIISSVDSPDRISWGCLLNPFSDMSAIFSTSKIGKYFKGIGSLNNPLEDVGRRGYLEVTSEEYEENQGSLIDFLRIKYGNPRLMPIDFNHFRGVVKL
jgi:hypothetical protein